MDRRWTQDVEESSGASAANREESWEIEGSGTADVAEGILSGSIGGWSKRERWEMVILE